MQRMVMYWFSGTGNTWRTATAFAQAMNARGTAVALRRMETVDTPGLGAQETLGLAFPIACFSTYPLVWQFLERLPPGNGRGVVLLMTMGGASGGMAGPLGRRLRAAGYRTLGALAAVMPGNYNNRSIPEAANAARVERMRHAVEDFCDALQEGRGRWPRGYPLWSAGWRALASTPRPWRWFKKLFPLAVDAGRCTRCGLCARLCPVGCIRMDDRPVWDATCQACQRCINYCPEHAIHVPGKPSERYTAAPLEVFLNDEGTGEAHRP